MDNGLKLRRKALEIAPNNIDVCDALSNDYYNIGLFYQAVQLRERCISLDPTSGLNYALLGKVQFYLGENVKGSVALEKAILLQPDNILALHDWAFLKLIEGDLVAVENTIKRIKEINPEIRTSFFEAFILAIKGEKEKALNTIRPRKSYMIYLTLGMKNEALDYLEESPENYLSLKSFPIFNELRGIPRFQR